MSTMTPPNGKPTPPRPVADHGESRIPEYLLAPLRRWRVALACALVAGCAAIAVAYRYGQNVWPVEGTIIYTPLPLGGLAAADYAPPNPQTLISLVKSPQRLQQVIDELELPATAKTLERSLQVSPQPNADTVRVSLEWPDADVGRAILDRLTRTYIRDMADLRRAKLGETLPLLQAERRTLHAQLEEARTAALVVEYHQNEEKLSASRRTIDRLKEALASDLPVEVEPDGSYRERLYTLIDSIRNFNDRVKEIDAETEVKKVEFDALEKANAMQVIAPLEYVRLKAELEVLAVRRKNAVAAAGEQRKELADLPRQQARAMLLRLGEEHAQIEARAEALKNALGARQVDVATVGDASANTLLAGKRLEHAENSYNAVSSRIAGLERFRDAPITELAMAHPAVVLDPRSNRKMLAVLVFGSLMSVAMLGLIGHAWLTGARRAAPPTCGLQILARNDRPGLPGLGHPATEARRLALQLREPIRESGGIVLFAAANPAVPLDDVVGQCARQLALWGERVLILDAREQEVAPPLALGDGSTVHDLGELDPVFANQPTRDCSAAQRLPEVTAALALLHQTDRADVSQLPVRRVLPDPDSLASAAMHALLVELSARFDRVLLVAAPLTVPLEPEILAGYADGAVVVLHCDDAETAAWRAAVDAIRAAGVPWVGACLRSSPRADGEGDLPVAREVGEADGQPRPAGGRADKVAEEEPGVLRVAWPKPSGFRPDAPGPLQAEPPEPLRGAPHAADEHVEGRTDLKAYRYP
jgi:Mrp family chromosome partitioning ATPase/uncharacterized protein involved in exopolysaccharide biosynthesis